VQVRGRGVPKVTAESSTCAWCFCRNLKLVLAIRLQRKCSFFLGRLLVEIFLQTYSTDAILASFPKELTRRNLKGHTHDPFRWAICAKLRASTRHRRLRQYPAAGWIHDRHRCL